ncbi:MAG: hypothetical protein AAB681_00880 [Patescibacteria group bacterium]
MSKKTSLVFVSGGPSDEIRNFERNIKKQYLTGDPANYPCLSFFHHSSEKEILEKVRAKKPAFLIFDHVNEEKILQLKTSILKKTNGASPEMIHTGINQEIPNVRLIVDHPTIADEIFQLITTN